MSEGTNGSGRLDRIERLLEVVAEQQGGFSKQLDAMQRVQTQIQESQSRLEAMQEKVIFSQSLQSRSIDFLLKNQATHNEQIRKHELALTSVTEKLDVVADRLRQIAQALERQGAAQTQLTAAQERAEIKMAELAEAQKHTEERLNATIGMMDNLRADVSKRKRAS